MLVAIALCNMLCDMTLHHSMKGCHVGKGGGTQLKLGSLWLLAMMVLVDCDQQFLIIGEHFVLRLEIFFSIFGLLNLGLQLICECGLCSCVYHTYKSQ